MDAIITISIMEEGKPKATYRAAIGLPEEVARAEPQRMNEWITANALGSFTQDASPSRPGQRFIDTVEKKGKAGE